MNSVALSHGLNTADDYERRPKRVPFIPVADSCGPARSREEMRSAVLDAVRAGNETLERIAETAYLPIHEASNVLYEALERRKVVREFGRPTKWRMA